MECNSCYVKNDYGKRVKKAWTSDVGKIEISYLLVPLEKFAKVMKKRPEKFTSTQYPFMLVFNYYVYQMKCSLCNEWGKVLFYPNILKAIGRELCRRVVYELD